VPDMRVRVEDPAFGPRVSRNRAADLAAVEASRRISVEVRKFGMPLAL